MLYLVTFSHCLQNQRARNNSLNAYNIVHQLKISFKLSLDKFYIFRTLFSYLQQFEIAWIMYECMNGLILYGFVYVFIMPVVNYRIDEEKKVQQQREPFVGLFDGVLSRWRPEQQTSSTLNRCCS